MDRMTQPIDYKNEFIKYMSDLVPVISNGFRLDEIFHDDEGLLQTIKQASKFYDEVQTIDQQLTKKWAKEVVHYPMSDDHNLARVAQYHQVMLEDSEKAKNEYLTFINDRLLKNYQDKKGYEAVVNQFRRGLRGPNFSNVVHELDLPNFSGQKKDPLRLFAQLPLPIYITTSYFSFIERALKKEGKKPITQYWSWSGGISGAKGINTRIEYLPHPEYADYIPPEPPVPIVPPRDCVPTEMRPVVYHLFGIEDVAKTLVISEDDYINFLMNASEDIRSSDSIPYPLREALSEKRLLLMGYNLRDWDFRALFRFISKFRERDRRTLTPSIAIQLMPLLKNKEIEKKSLDYLEKYFDDYRFNVKWIDKEQFVYELLNAWQTI